ncbi:MAG: hypothetical protein PHE68_05385 [Candidatus Peribacteraceae bacterium]|nr:hypothetical protein [Candidatus Peribacteraceae bacterium]MDD5074392.1 hypothetical protein [Candidatus Peribacteraceae bacterium]
MQQTCRNSWCKQSFEITQDDLDFYDKISPVYGGKKFLIPPPTLCPDCRQQRRLAINEFNLYPATCDLCKKSIISQYPPGTPNIVYCRECWHSDKWDPLAPGREFDFSRGFFEQFAELRLAVPNQALDVQGTLINSDYIHFAGACKNCYLIMHADFCEDCLYGYGFKKNTSCVDGFYNLHCELCYDCIDCHKCYGLVASQDCINCHSGWFLRDCVGCQDCILCVGLREKNYCIENVQLSKEDYEAKKAAIDLASYATYQSKKKRRKELERKHPFKAFQGNNLQNCSGNYLYNCKDARECFDCEDVESAKHCYQLVLAAKDVQDIYQYGTNLQMSYECSIVGENSYHILFSFGCHMSSRDLSYCWYMESCKNCFGCAFMKNSRYCIFNKQYSQEEYERLVPKIIEQMKKIGEWGEFFPLQTSQFGYNLTSAHLSFPLTEQSCKKNGIPWSRYEPSPPTVTKKIPAALLPDNTKDIPDDVLNWAIECEVTKKPFKLTAQELKFYRRLSLPVPRRSWQQRHEDRLHERNPRHLWTRDCMKCGKKMETTYAPERAETVYCEECYLKEVY